MSYKYLEILQSFGNNDKKVNRIYILLNTSINYTNNKDTLESHIQV